MIEKSREPSLSLSLSLSLSRTGVPDGQEPSTTWTPSIKSAPDRSLSLATTTQSQQAENVGVLRMTSKTLASGTCIFMGSLL